MNRRTIGIKETSEAHFLVPSDFSRMALYYVQQIGVLHCDAQFTALQSYWKSILIMFIDEGEMEVAIHKNAWIARKNDVVVIDCRQEYSFSASDDMSFRYFHFSGAKAWEYIQLLNKMNQSACIRNAQNPTMDSLFHNLLTIASGRVGVQEEHYMSVYLHMILCELVHASRVIPEQIEQDVLDTKSYIENHFADGMTLDDVIQHSSLEEITLNMYLRRKIGMSASQYKRKLQFQYAKNLLMKTEYTDSKIAEQCGFMSQDDFVYEFQDRFGMTPEAFREIPF